MKQVELHLIGGGEDEVALFNLIDEYPNCRLQCEYRDRRLEATASDFFEALCVVRNMMATDGLIPFCYGASLNVYPSGMARDMGRGLKAYKLKKGHRAEELVEIFAEAADVIPSSVERQREFWQDWLASPKK
ncbi:hypothetical protein [Rhizobium sp. BK376]|jgi:hypothetical protein|uniref:hypothetical protein n=1 Tax=Rhizobium sp. BK376 TaxID=2512149 RepID=UPI0010507107|nr:hypothetical protein [Rhizobium sp. BK376]TCR93297.1 hypothetical protein EV561_101743 [Rhizobium sp. BK376]